MVTAFYSALLGLWMVSLSVLVIKQRKSHLVSLGDGGVDELQKARSAQGNAVEYIPITLILMLLLEYHGGPHWLLHGAGVLFCVGRVAHAQAILSGTFKWRVSGMALTFLVILGLAVGNLVYLPYQQIFTM